MSTDLLQLLFLGTGTSAGIPMIGCHCDVCQSTDPHNHRMRASVVISYNGVRVLVDTTPELRLQALTHRIDNIDAVVFTHAHADHIMGLDDVRRYNAIRRGPLDIWADQPTFDMLKTCFGYAFREPDPEAKVFRPHLVDRLITGPFEIAGLTWQPIRFAHGKIDVLGFRIGSLAYCTDVSAVPDESWPLLEGVETLVLDALQWKPHATHLTIEQAIAVSRRIGAKATYFTHIAHALDHDTTNAQLPAGMQLAYDGLTITVQR